MNRYACRLTQALVLFSALATAGCGEDATGPSSSAVVTFNVQGEIFRVLLQERTQIEAARAAQNGGTAKIPNGRIVAGTQVNAGWSWHLEGVAFAESTIELCDGRPSDVEQQGTAFGGGRFCPWSATITRIEED